MIRSITPVVPLKPWNAARAVCLFPSDEEIARLLFGSGTLTGSATNV
jgi:hypothetical protein